MFRASFPLRDIMRSAGVCRRKICLHSPWCSDRCEGQSPFLAAGITLFNDADCVRIPNTHDGSVECVSFSLRYRRSGRAVGRASCWAAFGRSDIVLPYTCFLLTSGSFGCPQSVESTCRRQDSSVPIDDFGKTLSQKEFGNVSVRMDAVMQGCR